MHALTWDIPVVQLPKLNANLLAVISFVTLCVLALAMVHPALASHCEPEQKALTAALAALAVAKAAYVIALLTAGPIGIALAAAGHLAAVLAVDACQAALDRCNNAHNSGGCGS